MQGIKHKIVMIFVHFPTTLSIWITCVAIVFVDVSRLMVDFTELIWFKVAVWIKVVDGLAVGVVIAVVDEIVDVVGIAVVVGIVVEVGIPVVVGLTVVGNCVLQTWVHISPVGSNLTLLIHHVKHFPAVTRRSAFPRETSSVAIWIALSVFKTGIPKHRIINVDIT